MDRAFGQAQSGSGSIPADAERGRRSPKERPWDELTAAEQATEIRAMEIYAAMIDEVDRHTGQAARLPR